MAQRIAFLLRAAVGAAVVAACSSNQPPVPATPAVDSAAMRARADSLAAAARRDSLARADALARVRADSIARALEASRADSVRAEVERGAAAAAAATPSGLAPALDSVLASRVHFATDRADLDPEAQGILGRKLDLFRNNPRLEVQVEGHCDARASDEYNLALGNRRAAAVRDWLVAHGVAASRLTIISYGEERPLDPRNTEEAWAANRRAEFHVTRGVR